LTAIALTILVELEMANARLYRFWADLTEALKTGEPQNETKHSREPMFAKLYETPRPPVTRYFKR